MKGLFNLIFFFILNIKKGRIKVLTNGLNSSSMPEAPSKFDQIQSNDHTFNLYLYLTDSTFS